MSLLRPTLPDYALRKEPLLVAEAQQDSVMPVVKPSPQKQLARRIEKIKDLAEINQMRVQFILNQERRFYEGELLRVQQAAARRVPGLRAEVAERRGVPRIQAMVGRDADPDMNIDE